MDQADNLLFVANGNDQQGEMLLRLAAMTSERCPKAKFCVVSDDLSADYAAALSRRGVIVHVLSEAERERLKSEAASDAHALGKSAKPFLLEMALRRFAEPTSEVCYLDPDVVIQGELDPIRELAGDDRVVMAVEATPSFENVGAAMKLDRAIAAGLVTQAQCAAFPHEVNTGFQFGRREPFLRYLERLITFIRTDAAQAMLRNEGDRPSAWHDQDFFRCFLRAGDARDWLALAPFEMVATLAAEGYDKVEIWSSTPRARLVDGGAPIVAHYAGGAWRRSAAALAYFERAEIGEPRSPQPRVDIAALEQSAERLSAAEASAKGWREGFERLQAEHQELLQKWGQLKEKYAALSQSASSADVAGADRRREGA